MGKSIRVISSDKYYKKGLRQIRKLTSMLVSAYKVRSIRGKRG